MKKIILFLLVFYPAFLFAQYYPLPASTTAHWRVNKTYHQKGPCVEVENINYYFKGDTLINALQYNKLYMFGINYEQPQPPPNSCDTTVNHFSDIFIGGVRNSNGKVFLYDPLVDSEKLLYDFSLSVGDSSQRSYFGIGTNANVVVAIDSVKVGTRWCKRLFINASGNNQIDSSHFIAESVGSSIGLLEQEHFEANSSLLCYAENNIPIFPAGCSCTLNVGIEKLPSRSQPTISLFPNPAINTLMVRVTRTAIESKISLYNAQGALVKEVYLPANKTQIVIPIQKLSSGIYILQYSNAGGEKSVMFIKK